MPNTPTIEVSLVGETRELNNWNKLLIKSGIAGGLTALASILGTSAFNTIFGLSSLVPIEKIIQAPIIITAGSSLAYFLGSLAKNRISSLIKHESQQPPEIIKDLSLPSRLLDQELHNYCDIEPKETQLNRVVASHELIQLLHLTQGNSRTDSTLTYFENKLGQDITSIPREILTFLSDTVININSNLDKDPHTPPSSEFTNNIQTALDIITAIVESSPIYTQDKLAAIVNLKSTRRNFLNLSLITLGAIGYLNLKKKLEPVINSVYKRPMPETKLTLADFNEKYPDQDTFKNKIMQVVSSFPDKRENLIGQIFGSLGISAFNEIPLVCYTSTYKDQDKNRPTFAEYSIEFTADYLRDAINLGIEPETALSLMSHNIEAFRTPSNNPKLDVEQSRQQIIYNVLAVWGKKYGIPITELGYAYAYQKEENSDYRRLIRARGIPTFWTGDVEPEIYALGILSDSRLLEKIKKAIHPYDFAKFESSAISLRQARTNYEMDRKSLENSIDIYITNILQISEGDLSQTIFKDFFSTDTQKSETAWASIGLGQNPGFIDQLSQVTHYCHAWDYASKAQYRDASSEIIADNVIVSGILHTREMIRQTASAGDPQKALKLLIMDQIDNDNRKLISWLEENDATSNYVKYIVNMKVNSDLSGEVIRTNNPEIFDVLAPYEYDIECQKIAHLSIAKYLQEEIMKNEFLSKIAKTSPAWQTFLFLAIRDYPSTSISAGVVDGRPTNLAYQLPNRAQTVLSQLEKIIRQYQKKNAYSGVEILSQLNKDLSRYMYQTNDNDFRSSDPEIFALLDTLFSLELPSSINFAVERSLNILRFEPN